MKSLVLTLYLSVMIALWGCSGPSVIKAPYVAAPLVADLKPNSQSVFVAPTDGYLPGGHLLIITTAVTDPERAQEAGRRYFSRVEQVTPFDDEYTELRLSSPIPDGVMFTSSDHVQVIQAASWPGDKLLDAESMPAIAPFDPELGTGGVIFIEAGGLLTMNEETQLRADGLGFAGGHGGGGKHPATRANPGSTFSPKAGCSGQGGMYWIVPGTDSNRHDWGTSGSGGGHATQGQDGSFRANNTTARGGLTVREANGTLSTHHWHLGSGGGAGGTDHADTGPRRDSAPGSEGGRGGGILVVLAESIDAPVNSLWALGGQGVVDEDAGDWPNTGAHAGGGGGGAGGTIVLALENGIDGITNNALREQLTSQEPPVIVSGGLGGYLVITLPGGKSDRQRVGGAGGFGMVHVLDRTTLND